MNEFIINENDVCINPEKVLVYEDKQFIVSISLAANEDEQWSYGYSYEYKGGLVGCGGGCGGASFGKYSELFPTRETALIAGAEWLKNRIIKEGNHPNGKSNKILIEKLNEYLLGQMELFA